MPKVVQAHAELIDATVQALLGHRHSRHTASSTGSIEQGLLVGQVVDGRAVLVAFVPTPADAATGSAQAQIAAIKAPLVQSHAGSVARMLPGGLSVLGIYLFAPADVALAKTAFATYKKLLGALGDVLPPQQDPLLFSICSQSKKLAMRSFDVRDREFEAAVVEFKQVAQAIPFVRLDAVVDVELDVMVPAGSGAVASAVDRALTQESRRIADAVVAAAGHGTVFNDNDATVRDVVQGQQAHVELLLPPSVASSSGQPRTQTSQTRMRISGSVSVVACVAARESLHTAAAFLKADAQASLHARLELFMDDLEDEAAASLQDRAEGSLKAPLQLVLPKRQIMEQFPFYSDYTFQDDDAQAQSDRLLTLLNLDVGTVSFRSSEAFAAPAQRPSATPSAKPAQPAHPPTQTAVAPPEKSTAMPLAAIVAVIAVVLAVLFAFVMQ